MKHCFPKNGFIWVIPVSSQRWLWKPLALHLSEKTGLKPLLIVLSDEDKQFYQQQYDKPFNPKHIVLTPDYLDRVISKKCRSSSELMTKAVDYEAKHKVTLMRDMIQSCRHHGRGFTFGWNGLPKSQAGNASSILPAIDACVESIEYFDDLSKKFPPALVICAGATGIALKPIALLCRSRKVPFRCLAQGRVNTLFYWGIDEFENSPEFEKTFNSCHEPNSLEIKNVAEDLQANAAFRVFGPQMLKYYSPFYTAKEVGFQLIHHAYAQFRGYRKAKFGFTGRSTGWMLIKKFLAVRKYTKQPYFAIEDLPPDRKIVFFPLGNEPEASVQGQSPEFSNQYTLLCEMALSLPADAILVVKEHPIQLGRRNTEFYKRIDAMPNTVMLQVHLPSRDIIDRSALVCTVNGSAAYEAAMLGKQVAYFSRHGPIKTIPHVKLIKCFEDLSWVQNVLSSNNAASAAKRLSDGAKFYLAATKYCMNLEALNFHSRTTPPNSCEMDLIADPLLASL